MYLFELKEGWYEIFNSNKERLMNVLSIVEKDHYVVPSIDRIFRPFTMIDLSEVRVVIVGQNPYNTMPGMANGIPFALDDGFKISSTIKCINQELLRCYNKELTDYSFEKWISQGVLLLNSMFTTTLKGHKSSVCHKDIWVFFVQNLLYCISKSKPSTVFMLWGKEAHSLIKTLKGMDINVIKSPFPLDRSGGNNNDKFVGSDVFIKCDKILGNDKITWV